MEYKFVVRINRVPTIKRFTLEYGDLAEVISDSRQYILKETGADKNSPIFAIIK